MLCLKVKTSPLYLCLTEVTGDEVFWFRFSCRDSRSGYYWVLSLYSIKGSSTSLFQSSVCQSLGTKIWVLWRVGSDGPWFVRLLKDVEYQRYDVFHSILLFVVGVVRPKKPSLWTVTEVGTFIRLTDCRLSRSLFLPPRWQQVSRPLRRDSESVSSMV